MGDEDRDASLPGGWPPLILVTGEQLVNIGSQTMTNEVWLTRA